MDIIAFFNFYLEIEQLFYIFAHEKVLCAIKNKTKI